MTLHEVIEQTRTRFAMTEAETRTLTEAVIAIVDDGQLAVIADDAELARKLGEPSMHRVAQRILEQRLEHATLHPSVLPPDHPRAPEATQELAALSSPARKRAAFKCSACNQPGHNSRTCPELGRTPQRPRGWKGLLF